jgi:diguanylate cyclase (GGDEF)-like protein
VKNFRELLAPTDPAIIEAGAGGERFVARVRIIFWATIWIIPLATLLTMEDSPPEVWISFGASSFALLVSVAFFRVVQRYRDVPAVPFATAAFDVSLVTLTLLATALAGRPYVAVNSHVVWPVYLLAVAATAFRLDFRVCLFAGGLGAAQYAALIVWVAGRLDRTRSAVTEYGQFSWPTQVGKLLLLLAATALTAGIIHQARKFAHVSGNDRLTGLGNRALFDEKVRIELARAERSGTPIALAFVDIDHFKAFNDRWGHDTGDNALRIVADALRSQLRLADSAFRWGGEEMIVLLPETDVTGAIAVLERLRSALRDTTLAAVPDDVRITVSVGVAEYPREGTSPDELLQRADQRLLAAKRTGRDRIVAADDPSAARRAS